jgi:hypothetical protein
MRVFMVVSELIKVSPSERRGWQRWGLWRENFEREPLHPCLSLGKTLINSLISHAPSREGSGTDGGLRDFQKTRAARRGREVLRIQGLRLRSRGLGIRV